MRLTWLADRFELERGGSAHNLRPMEGLRGLAVALVFGVHFSSLSMPWQTEGWDRALLDVLHGVGNAGVDLFFVLSGYLIYGHLMRRPPPFPAYMARRIQRIYPAFLAVFALYLLLAWQMPQADKLPADGALGWYLLANVLLLPGLFPIEPLITVAWSLSYEMFFYLVMPLIIAVLALRKMEPLARFGVLAAFTVAALLAFGVWGGPVRLCMFLFGALLVEWPRPWRAPGSLAGALAGLLALGLMLVPAPGPAGQAWRILGLGLGFALLCQACFAGRAPLLAQLMTWLPLRWLGNMSYSYYLLHGLALHAFFAVLPRFVPAGEGGAAALLLPAFAWTLIPSAALFLAVERPWSLAPRPRVARPAAGGRA